MEIIQRRIVFVIVEYIMKCLPFLHIQFDKFVIQIIIACRLYNRNTNRWLTTMRGTFMGAVQ